MSLRRHGDDVVLGITDDGVGFDVRQDPASPRGGARRRHGGGALRPVLDRRALRADRRVAADRLDAGAGHDGDRRAAGGAVRGPDGLSARPLAVTARHAGDISPLRSPVGVRSGPAAARLASRPWHSRRWSSTWTARSPTPSVTGTGLRSTRRSPQAGLDWHWDVDLYGTLLGVAGGKERIRHYCERYDRDVPEPSGRRRGDRGPARAEDQALRRLRGCRADQVAARGARA